MAFDPLPCRYGSVATGEHAQLIQPTMEASPGKTDIYASSHAAIFIKCVGGLVMISLMLVSATVNHDVSSLSSRMFYSRATA